MQSLADLILKWPLVRQIVEGKDGTGLESMSEATRGMHARIDDAEVARSICPFCAVGCGQLIYHKEGSWLPSMATPSRLFRREIFARKARHRFNSSHIRCARRR